MTAMDEYDHLLQAGYYVNHALTARRSEFDRLAPKLRPLVFARDGHTCQFCGAHGEGVVLHPDHRVPLFEGGSNNLDNLQTLCARCNLRKGGEEGRRARRRLERERRQRAEEWLRDQLTALGGVW